MSFKIQLPPGVRITETGHSVPGRWHDANHVIFRDGKPEKMAGWGKRILEQTVGIVRGMFGWVTAGGQNIFNAGDYAKLYAVTDEIVNITPLRSDGTLANDPFAVVDTDNTVTVTHVGHGLVVGATVFYSGATAGGGITIDGEYLVTSVPTANSYTVEHSAPATATDATTGGAAVAYEYEISPGAEEGVVGTGYGVGSYGGGLYGTPRVGAGGIVQEQRTWFIQKYGDRVVVHPSGGTLYEWDEAGGMDRAEAVANAPESARAMFVTPEGYVVMLGCDDTAVAGVGDAMTLAWPDRDDITEWAVTKTNRANVRALKTGNKLVCGAALTNLSVVWADNTTYRMQHLGDFEIVFETPVIGQGIGIFGPLAHAEAGTPSITYWMSGIGFHMSDGVTVGMIPNQEDVQQFVSRSLDARYAAKFNAFYNPITDSVQFNYVSVDSPNRECDRYVIVNRADYSWTVGEIDRSSYTVIHAGLYDVVAASPDRYFYTHETGLNDDGGPMDWFIRSGMIALGESDQDMDVDRYIHDADRQTGSFDLEVELYERPMSGTPVDSRSFEIEQGSEGEDIHLGGRHAVVEFSGDGLGTDWRIGTPMFSLKGAGQR